MSLNQSVFNVVCALEILCPTHMLAQPYGQRRLSTTRDAMAIRDYGGNVMAVWYTEMLLAFRPDL